MNNKLRQNANVGFPSDHEIVCSGCSVWYATKKICWDPKLCFVTFINEKDQLITTCTKI